MKNIGLLLFLFFCVNYCKAQQMLDSTEISINAAIQKMHNENIVSKDSIYINNCKVLIWKINIPSVYETLTLMYSFNSFGYCFKYERFSDFKNYKRTYDTIEANSTKIDETHFIDSYNVKWTFNFSRGADYFSLIADR